MQRTQERLFVRVSDPLKPYKSLTSHGVKTHVQALGILQRMREDPSVELDAMSYSSAIIACERCGRTEEAMQLLRAMQSAGFRPSGYTYAVRSVSGVIVECVIQFLSHL